MSHPHKPYWRSSSIWANVTAALAVLVLPIIPPDARPWLLAVLLANAANRLRIRVPVTISGPVQIGGTTFTSTATIGVLAGDDIGTLTETPRLVGSPPFVEVVTRASGGVLPETTLQPPDDDPLRGGTR